MRKTSLRPFVRQHLMVQLVTTAPICSFQNQGSRCDRKMPWFGLTVTLGLRSTYVSHCVRRTVRQSLSRKSYELVFMEPRRYLGRVPCRASAMVVRYQDEALGTLPKVGPQGSVGCASVTVAVSIIDGNTPPSSIIIHLSSSALPCSAQRNSHISAQVGKSYTKS